MIDEKKKKHWSIYGLDIECRSTLFGCSPPVICFQMNRYDYENKPSLNDIVIKENNPSGYNYCILRLDDFIHDVNSLKDGPNSINAQEAMKNLRGMFNSLFLAGMRDYLISCDER